MQVMLIKISLSWQNEFIKRFLRKTLDLVNSSALCDLLKCDSVCNGIGTIAKGPEYLEAVLKRDRPFTFCIRRPFS
jgi:hypothetical protein